ncbi:MAG: LacI family DNA-binding transcriptional regulator, partial [Vallitaleaceae bacterium]|nr:LacI family DNA-binding transcriptional regulator [Vallitaleaceae bacterium]
MNIKEVARQAGVSISTVSRVINHTAKVSPDVKERVEAVIRANNYRPNVLARQLQQNRTNTIGVIMSVEELNMNSLSEAVNSIGDELKTLGYSMLFVNSRFHSEEELEFFHLFQEKRVDGILYFAAGFTPRHYEILENYPIPIVMIGQENGRLG